MSKQSRGGNRHQIPHRSQTLSSLSEECRLLAHQRLGQSLAVDSLRQQYRQKSMMPGSQYSHQPDRPAYRRQHLQLIRYRYSQRGWPGQRYTAGHTSPDQD